MSFRFKRTKQQTKICIPELSRVLVVEDNSERVLWFRDKLKTETVFSVYATSVKEALMFLSPESMIPLPFDIVFLDHDAGIEGDDFLPVAKRLRELNYKGTVIVHSMSDPGAARIRGVLPNSARVPFGTFELEVV